MYSGTTRSYYTKSLCPKKHITLTKSNKTILMSYEWKSRTFFCRAIKGKSEYNPQDLSVIYYCEDSHKDLFQEVTIQLWKAFPKFRGDSKFSTWAYRVALNTAITLYRKQTLNSYCWIWRTATLHKRHWLQLWRGGAN
jgi:hypothetical protein